VLHLYTHARSPHHSNATGMTGRACMRPSVAGSWLRLTSNGYPGTAAQAADAGPAAAHPFGRLHVQLARPVAGCTDLLQVGARGMVSVHAAAMPCLVPAALAGGRRYMADGRWLPMSQQHKLEAAPAHAPAPYNTGRAWPCSSCSCSSLDTNARHSATEHSHHSLQRAPVSPCGAASDALTPESLLLCCM
jgi:hypothetical protein